MKAQPKKNQNLDQELNQNQPDEKLANDVVANGSDDNELEIDGNYNDDDTEEDEYFEETDIEEDDEDEDEGF